MCRKPISVRAFTTPRQLARILTENNISGAPVLNGGDHVIGVVSRTDLLQWCVKGGLGFGASDLLRSLAEGGSGSRIVTEDLGIVADFMTTSPVTASPDEPLAHAAQRMAERKVHRLVVLDEHDRLIGIVTSLDVLKAFPR